MENYTVVLAGNPNVGKSTVFNALTGMKQHTGNWAGKTVGLAVGEYTLDGATYKLIDVPGTYSLTAHSGEEEIARDYICFGEKHCVIIVCDATCVERNLNLVLQVLEVTNRAVVCINLIDEAQKKDICVDTESLEHDLGVPVVAVCARSKKGIAELIKRVDEVIKKPTVPLRVGYPFAVESRVKELETKLSDSISEASLRRWAALRLLENDTSFVNALRVNLGIEPILMPECSELGDKIASALVLTAEGIAADAVCVGCGCNRRERRIDRLLTDKKTGFPIMLMFFLLIFWLTIVGANYPSSLLSNGFEALRGCIDALPLWTDSPPWLYGILMDGIYSVVTWVVSVMLPPMAIFFPLFTIMEDFGYLPRIAFNLDRFFKRAGACGKQSLTMAMGFGCNACGVTGARIIDSPRERLIAIVTNVFVPCNGRYPMLIAIISMFFVTLGGFGGSLLSALILTAVIAFGVVMTLLISRLLSRTLLKGKPSSFTLELPPFRRPQFGRVIVRSILDRTLFVLGRAVVVALPAGAFIWLMANIYVADASLLQYCADFLDPLGKLMGLDGIILMAFILGFPANEIVLPLAIMGYLSAGVLMPADNLSAVRELLVANGWSWATAVSMLLFALMHFPCSTTCITVYRETKSLKWTFLSFVIPTAAGICCCCLFNLVIQSLQTIGVARC